MTGTDSREWPAGLDALFPGAAEDRLRLDAVALERLAALLDMDPTELSVTVRSLVRVHGGETPAFEMRTDVWRIDLPVAVAKSVLVGAIATSVLQLLGADAVPVAVVSAVAPLVFEVRRVELRPSDAVIHARLTAAAGGDPHRLEDLHRLLPSEVRAELSLAEFADVVERLLRARLAVVGPDGLRVRARDTRRGFRLMLSDPPLPPVLLSGADHGRGAAEPTATSTSTSTSTGQGVPARTAPSTSSAPSPPPDPSEPDAAPRVFVTYAHDSYEHKENVRAFGEFLATSGIDVRMDQWELHQRRDWHLWSIREMKTADFVIVVASPECRRVGDGEVGQHERRGLQSELRLLRELYNRDNADWTPRVLPVVLPGGSVDDIPLFLTGGNKDHYPVTGFSMLGAQDLLRTLTGQPPYVRPVLGTLPKLPPHPPVASTAQASGAPDRQGTGSPSVPTVPLSAIDASRQMYEDVGRKAATVIVPRAALEGRHLPRIRRRVTSSRALPVPLLGEAGIGKSVMSAQIFRALDEQQDVTALLVNCEYVVAAVHDRTDLDRALGALLAPAASGPVPLTAVTAACADRWGRQVVLVLDTVDYLLNAETAPSVLGLLHTLHAQNVLVVFTCRQHDFDNWLAPGYARLAVPMEDNGVPPLTKDEVVLVVQGYLERHHLQDARPDFVARVLAAHDDPDRSALTELIANPLHLLMFCELFAGADSFPPDLSATRLMRRYSREKVTASRRYPRTTVESLTKQRLISSLSHTLWKDSGDTLSLWTPEIALPLEGVGLRAYQDLLSETVLVQRESLSGEQVGFRHQALTEYFIAMHLHRTRTERDDLLEELRERPHDRWFAWQMVRHLVAMADPEEVRDLLDRLDREEIVAFRAVVFGAVEEHREGLLLSLAARVRHSGEVFGKQLIEALPSVPDSGLEEAVRATVRLLGEVSPGQVCAVARSAARLVPRGGERAGPWLVTLLEQLRGRMADPSSALEFPLAGDVVRFLLAPYVERGHTLPAEALSAVRDLLHPRRIGAPAVRELARAFLLPGTAHTEQVHALTAVLSRGSYRDLHPVDGELVLRVVPWAYGSTTGRRELDDPLAFLTAGGKQITPVRYTSFARVANEKPPIAALLAGAFLTSDDNAAAHHLLHCLQQAVQTGGDGWVAEALRAADSLPPRSAGTRQVCAVLTAFAKSPKSIRVPLAAWFEQRTADWSRQPVDAYLRLVHDEPELLSGALGRLAELSAREQERVIANLAREGDGVAEEIVLTMLDGDRTGAEDAPPRLSPAVEARLCGLVADRVPHARERLVELVTADSHNAAEQALHQLEVVAAQGEAWLYAELLTPLASHRDPWIRHRVLNIVAPLVRTHRRQASAVVHTWLEEAAGRAAEGIKNPEELGLLLHLVNNFCRGEGSSVAAAEDAISALLDRTTQDVESVEKPVVRQLVALLKTLCALRGHRLRPRAAGWLFHTLRHVEVNLHRDEGAWAREALGHLVEAEVVELDQVMDDCAGWIPDNQLVMVDLIISHDVRRAASPHLDTLLERGCSPAVAESIVAHRHPAD